MTTQSRFDQTLFEIEEGRLGRRRGLDMGFDRFVDILPGLQRRTMYVVGGETGSGKSSFGLDAFVFNPFEHWKKGDSGVGNLRVFYWSLEMHPNMIIAKAICRRIWLDHGLLVDVNYVLSRGRNKVDARIYELVKSYRDYFAEMEDHVSFLESGHPTAISARIIKHMSEIGTVERRPITITDEFGNRKEVQEFHRYIPRVDEQVVVVLDHVALMKREANNTKKVNIDRMTDYAVSLRNRYGVTFVFIQQLNRDSSSADRFKLNRVEPQLSDFKETSDTTDAANVVLALFNPYRYNIEEHRGFDIRKLRDRFRYLKLLKSRDGISDVGIGMRYIGEVGMFSEFPKAENMKPEDYAAVDSILKYR